MTTVDDLGEVATRPARRRRRRVLRSVAALLLVGAVAGLGYAWHRGFLQRSYWAATLPCGDVAWLTGPPATVPEPLLELTQVDAGPVVVPTDVAFHPDLGHGFVADQLGTVHLLSGDEVLDEAVIDLRDDTSTAHDQGLLGLAVAPDARHLYAYRTDAAGDSVLVAWPLVDGRPGDEPVEVLRVAQDSVHHNGGGLRFGPDGFLYLTLGDGGAIGDRWNNGQRADTLLGAVLRLDPTPDDPTRPYRVPPTNPFVDEPGARDEVWALGTRNPFRISFDPEGALWVADVGHDCVEEVTRIPAGAAAANLGWNRREGTRTFVGGPADGELAPTIAYPNDGDWCAVIGGHVATLPGAPGIDGHYLFGDLCSGRVLAATTGPGPSVVTDTGLQVSGLVGFARSPDGASYVLSIGTGVARLDAPGADRPSSPG
jgi:glucose/arabinose dehydrogenase